MSWTMLTSVLRSDCRLRALSVATSSAGFLCTPTHAPLTKILVVVATADGKISSSASEFQSSSVSSTGLAEHPIQKQRVRDRPNPILTGHEHDQFGGPDDLPIVVDQRGDLGVKLTAGGQSRRAVGAGPLGGVVEVRQVDDREVRRGRSGRLDEASRDPPRRFDAGDRPPKLVERKLAQRLAERRVERLGIGVAPHRFGAIGVVLRRGEADQIGGGVL